MSSNLRSRSRYWCITDHDAPKTRDELRKKYDCWLTRERNQVHINYAIFGLETAPTTGKKHYQAYIEFDREVSLVAVVKGIPGPHFELRKGTAQQAREYCTKENNWFEIGKISEPESGKRTDIDTIKEMAVIGTPMSEIVKVATSYQAIKYAEKIREYTDKNRRWKPEVSWFYGATGTGKTKTAFEEAEATSAEPWVSSGSLRWWQGYDGHENVIIDDFRGDFCPLHTLLNILDRYPFKVEVKGGSRSLLAKRIWITCPYHPEAVYRDRGEGKNEDIKQLLRRIDRIQLFENKPTEYDGWDPIEDLEEEPAAHATPTRGVAVLSPPNSRVSSPLG